MEFCNKCDNIYYIEIKDGVLIYKCKKCKNFIDLNEINNKSYLIKTDIQKKKTSYEYIINEYTKYDNTLPRIKHIKCPRCSELKVNYEEVSGYGNTVMGVPSGDISSVNGVATANISKVNGV